MNCDIISCCRATAKSSSQHNRQTTERRLAYRLVTSKVFVSTCAILYHPISNRRSLGTTKWSSHKDVVYVGDTVFWRRISVPGHQLWVQLTQRIQSSCYNTHRWLVSLSMCIMVIFGHFYPDTSSPRQSVTLLAYVG